MDKRKQMLRLLIIVLPILLIAFLVYKRIGQIQGYVYHGENLIINEVMADNLTTLKNENGIYADWVEVYNPSSEEVKLGNYYLSDDKSDLSKWRFPDITLAPKGYLVLFCDNDINGQNQFIHTNFMLNSDNETLYLSDANGTIVDKMVLKNQKCNVSYGRIYGSTEKAGFLPYSTAGYANPSSFWQQEEEYFQSDGIVFSADGGIYQEELELSLKYNDPDAVILYTLDGSEPDIASPIYNKPITISERKEPNQYTTQKCVAGKVNADISYGVNEVYKATIIRARVLKDGKLSSDIYTNTYFINPEYSFPLVSLTTNPENLFDPKEGSYVLGSFYYMAKRLSIQDNMIANYSLPQDMEGHIEIYDNSGCILSDDVSFSIAGGASAAENLQKSFNVVLENKRIRGDVLGALPSYQYEKFSLRGSGGAVTMENMFAYPSCFITNYLKQLDIGTQASQFCILFIDGEYWGIYNLMEPKGKAYLEQHYNIEKKEISLVVPYQFNTTDEFDKLFEMISQRHFDTLDDYNWIKTKINMDNYIQFVIAEAYFGNADALKFGDHNLYIWKAEQGLWNWQAYDFDSTLVDGENYFLDLIHFEFDGEGEDKKNFSVWLFQKLWNCSAFREELGEKLETMCNELFVTERVLAEFDTHIQILSAEMEENLRRCEMDYNLLKKFSYNIRNIVTEYDNYTLEDWNNTIFDMRRFFGDRTETIRNFWAEALSEP